jgi:flagellar biosynthetic protein FliQ
VNEADAIELGRQAIWTVLLAAGPAVLCGMAVGIVIALLQAVTQVQEATLTFVPKMLAILLVLAMASSFIGGQVGLFTELVYGHIVSGF